MYKRQPLVLVNRQHPLQPGGPVDLTAVDSRHPDILLDRQAAQLLAACVRKAGGGAEIVPVSGWRSQAEQQRIWDDTLAESGAEDVYKRQPLYPEDGDTAGQALLNDFQADNHCYTIETTVGNTVVDPNGTLYMTANSASGSKYYELISAQQDYIAEQMCISDRPRRR